MQVYLVGGAVRDALLGHPVQDMDFMVQGASPQALLSAGFTPVGRDFPVFLHPVTRDEYALARRERKMGTGHRGFVTDVQDVSAVDDLLRRDLTINALAYPLAGLNAQVNADEIRQNRNRILDPYGGIADLEAGVLRHVSWAFCEDPLRVLRLARFYARFAKAGFVVHASTRRLSIDMAQSGVLSHLSPQRIFMEGRKAMEAGTGALYWGYLQKTGILMHLLPALAHVLTADTLDLVAQASCNKAPLQVLYALLHKDDAKAVALVAQDAPKRLIAFANHVQSAPPLTDISAKEAYDLITRIKANESTATDLVQALTYIQGQTASRLMRWVRAYREVGIKDIPPHLTGRQIQDALTQERLKRLDALLP